MKKIVLPFLVLFATLSVQAQTAYDLFNNPNVKISWLGVDYAHIKLIGKFSEFADFGDQSLAELKNDYFPAWNKVVVNERKKYDIAGMLRRNEVYYDIDMIMAHNEKAALDKLEAYNEPNYSPEDIQKFVKSYNLRGKEGIGIVFIAEAYNKAVEMATYHFVAINMGTGKVIFQQRVKGEPGGFGLRNYWANSIHEVIEKIHDKLYLEWQESYPLKKE